MQCLTVLTVVCDSCISRALEGAIAAIVVQIRENEVDENTHIRFHNRMERTDEGEESPIGLRSRCFFRARANPSFIDAHFSHK